MKKNYIHWLVKDQIYFVKVLGGGGYDTFLSHYKGKFEEKEN